MADGKTHDRITYFTVMPVSYCVFLLVGSNCAVMFSVAYLFAGLMFNGDLDTESTPYYRWKFLRWIWLPYRKFGHRSKWTHGFLRGTATRLLWISPFILISLGIVISMGHMDLLLSNIKTHWQAIIFFIIGLEAGSMSHTLADITSSAWKRFIYKTLGIRILPSFVKRNKK